MTVLYSERTTPLSTDGANALATGVVLAWDFTGMGALAEGAAYEFAGVTNPTLVKTGTITQVTKNGVPGRQASASSLYEYTNTTNYGLQVGTSDFQIDVELSTGASLPTNNNQLIAFQVRNAGGTVIASIIIEEFASNGWYMNAGGTAGLGSSAGATFYGINKTLMFSLRRVSGIVSGWTIECVPGATWTRRYNDGTTDTTAWDNTSATRVRAIYNTSAAAIDVAVSRIHFRTAALSDTGSRDVGRDPWAIDENAHVSDSIAITSPTSGSSIPTTTTISGTYAYASGAPTGIQVQHGAGSWVSLTGFSAASGNWSGSAVLPAASAASLRPRDTVTPAIVGPDITNITVVANGITFAARNHATYGATQAVANRIFQRNGLNQATVRLVGTYTGSPTAIEWRHDGGTWATAVASPSGGTYDASVTVGGPAQGALEVRFANDTAVNASLSAVGVGDVYICVGQSNHRGAATSYVTPSAPGAHTGWRACEMDKQHLWRENLETSGTKFDAVTSAVYSAYTTGSPLGSYFGSLATLVMAAGVPVAFVPCAEGSTSIDNWSSASTATSTLYGAALATAGVVGAHKALLWWQGEFEMAGGGTPSAWASKMATIMAAWASAGQTSKWWLVMPCFAANGGTSDCTTVRAQIASLSGNSNVNGIVDMDSPTAAYSGGVHYDTPTQINTVAARMFSALYPAISFAAGVRRSLLGIG